MDPPTQLPSAGAWPGPLRRALRLGVQEEGSAFRRLRIMRPGRREWGRPGTLAETSRSEAAPAEQH